MCKKILLCYNRNKYTCEKAEDAVKIFSFFLRSLKRNSANLTKLILRSWEKKIKYQRDRRTVPNYFFGKLALWFGRSLHEIVRMIWIFFEPFCFFLHAFLDFQDGRRLGLVVLVAARASETFDNEFHTNSSVFLRFFELMRRHFDIRIRYCTAKVFELRV